MTQRILEKIEEAENPYPKINSFLKGLKNLAKKNILLFQFAFGSVTFGLAVRMVFNIDRVRFDEVTVAQLAFWIALFAVYIITIWLEHWKNKLELSSLADSKTIKKFDDFLGKFQTWSFSQASHMTAETAVDFFDKCIKVYSVVTASSIDQKLTTALQLMNDMIFSTSMALKLNGLSAPEGKAPEPKITYEKKIQETPPASEEEIEEIIDEATKDEIAIENIVES